jgi:hypothetical protein
MNKTKTKYYTNPATGESLTIKQWSERLNITPGGFHERVRKFGIGSPKMFARRVERYDLCSAPVNGALAAAIAIYCTHPRTGVSRLAFEWAEYYGVDLVDWYRAMRRLGPNSEGLFRCFDPID